MLKPDNSDHGNEPDLLKIHSSILGEAGFVECAYTLADSGLYANVTTLTAQIKEVGFSDPY